MPKRKEPGKGSGNLLIAQQEAFRDNPNGEVLTKGKDSMALIEKMGVEWVGGDSRSQEKSSDRPSRRPEAMMSTSGIRDNYIRGKVGDFLQDSVKWCVKSVGQQPAFG